MATHSLSEVCGITIPWVCQPLVCKWGYSEVHACYGMCNIYIIKSAGYEYSTSESLVALGLIHRDTSTINYIIHLE